MEGVETSLTMKDENVQEYFLEMKELASRGSIEVEAVIKCVIDRINDDTSNKVILYGARTLNDFKTKLRVYDDLREKTSKQQKKEECKQERKK